MNWYGAYDVGCVAQHIQDMSGHLDFVGTES